MKTIILSVLLLVILCACNSSGAFSGANSSSSQASSESSVVQAASLPQASEAGSSSESISIDEERQKRKELIAKLTAESTLVIKQGNYNYLFFSHNEGGLLCRMICIERAEYADGNLRYDFDFDKTIIIPDTDSVFQRGIDNENTLELSYDFWGKQATLTVEKTNYYLDFENELYTHEVKYRLKDLSPHYLIDSSPENKLQLYATYVDGGGESQWGDYVILNTKTQDIWYIADYDLYDQTIFCGTDSILITRYNKLELLDVYTGKTLSNVPKFEYGQSEQLEGRTKYCTVGVAHDIAQKKTLIAYRETGDEDISYEPTFKIYIAVFDESGKQINTIDTGFMMQPFIAVFPNHVTFESVENGVAIISTYVSTDASQEKIELGSISY